MALHRHTTGPVVTILCIGLLTVELRTYDSQFRPFTKCVFKSGVCNEQTKPYLPEGRLNLDRLTSAATSSGSISVTPSTGSLDLTGGNVFRIG